jgi:hypothetical protein
MSGEPRTPDEDIPQDPGIPGGDVISDPSDSPPPDEQDASTEERERPDDPDREGHMSSADS